MSTASSPKRRDGLRVRTPSKSTPIQATSSEVHIDAQPTYGHSIEEKAQSRQKLSKHLTVGRTGSSNLTPPTSTLARQRSSSSGSINSVLSVRSSASTDAHDTHRAGSGGISPLASPSGTPVNSPSLTRRRASAGPPALPRSPSWYRSTSRKASLAQPTLSTIEGSVSDLRTQEIDTQTRAQILSTAPADISEESLDLAGSSTMKRERASVNGIDNPKSPKRQATAERKEESARSSQSISSREDDRSNKTDANPSSCVASKTSHVASDSAPSSAPGQVHANTLGIENAASGWLSYFTLSRSPRLSSMNKQAGHTVGPEAATEASSSTVRSEGNGAEHLNSTLKSHDVRNDAQTATLASSSKLDVKTINAIIAQQPEKDATHDATPIDISRSQNGAPLDDNNQKTEDLPADTLRFPVDGRIPGHEKARPISWWSWGTVSESKSESRSAATVPALMQHDTPVTLRDSQDIHITSDDVVTPRLPNKKELPQPGIADGQSTWSSWLGGYVGRPVSTTTITYAAGVAPSITSSSASTVTAPDADESSPEPPPEPDNSTNLPDISAIVLTPGLQGRNPLVDVVPRSSWSSFFTARTLPIQKTLDNKPTNVDEPEVMEIDFGPSASDPAVHQQQSTGPKSNQANAGSKLSFSSLPLKASGSRTSNRSNGTSVSTPNSKPGSSQMDRTSSSSSSTIKPLTKDRTGSKGSTTSTGSKTKRSDPPKPPRPNLVLPSYDDVFFQPPRSFSLHSSPSHSPVGLKKAVKASLGYFFSSAPSKAKTFPTNQPIIQSIKGKEREILGDKHEHLPKDHAIAGTQVDISVSGKVAVIGVHGWFIQGYLKNVIGEPTGTSTKFANMMKAAVKSYYEEKGSPLHDEAITAIPLEGDGTVKDRAERLYENLMARQDWIDAVNTADRIFVASHSQGTIVSAMLVERLINEGEINGTKCMMLNMCSISQGPFYSLYNSWTVPAYLYFETAAATELFEFQKPNSAVSKSYRNSLHHILNAGVKILFIASLNDQVVPLYSALFSSISHPNVLRSIFIDSSVFETSADFMTNLVVFSTRLRNAGLNCHGLDFHLSEALMGSLTGIGHSTVYEEPLVYRYAIRYLFETTSPLLHSPRNQSDSSAATLFEVDDFNARAPANPFYLPWALRGIIEDTQIQTIFGEELQSLRDQFETWQPKTKALQQVQAALEPLRLIPRTAKSEADFEASVSRTDKKATAKL